MINEGLIHIEGKLSGFSEFESMLDDLPTRVVNRVLQQATTGAMREAEPAMIDAVPEHKDKQSAASQQYGDARSNIKVEALKNVHKGQKGARITTGNAFWLYFYEIGTRHQPARPFFANTFRSLIDTVLSYLADKIGEGIERQAIEK